jgi:hypothetical protein
MLIIEPLETGENNHCGPWAGMLRVSPWGVRHATEIHAAGVSKFFTVRACRPLAFLGSASTLQCGLFTQRELVRPAMNS